MESLTDLQRLEYDISLTTLSAQMIKLLTKSDQLLQDINYYFKTSLHRIIRAEKLARHVKSIYDALHIHWTIICIALFTELQHA